MYVCLYLESNPILWTTPYCLEVSWSRILEQGNLLAVFRALQVSLCAWFKLFIMRFSSEQNIYLSESSHSK